MNQYLYRYTEDALRDYPRDIMRLQALREYLSASPGPDLSASRVDGGDIVPEQERVLYRMERSHEYKSLSTRVRSMSLFLAGLAEDDYRLVDLRYFRALTWARVADEMHIAINTCMQRRAPRIVIRAAHVLFGDLAL